MITLFLHIMQKCYQEVSTRKVIISILIEYEFILIYKINKFEGNLIHFYNRIR